MPKSRPRLGARTLLRIGGRTLVATLVCMTSARLGRAEAPLFEPPAPGSYELPAIDRVQEWSLVDSSGARVPLLGLRPGEVALVAFIYRSCSEAAGCPMTLSTLVGVDRALARQTQLSKRVHLVTVSFDPESDTPERMAEMRAQLAPRSDWRFFTAPSSAELAPILEDFGQDAVRLHDEKGRPLPTIRHVVKVFLVDAQRDVRNVYSAGLLSVPLLLADLETVLAETPAPDRKAAQ